MFATRVIAAITLAVFASQVSALPIKRDNAVGDLVNDLGDTLGDIIRGTHLANADKVIDGVPVVGPVFDEVNDFLGEIVDGILRRDAFDGDVIEGTVVKIVDGVNGLVEDVIHADKIVEKVPVIGSVFGEVNDAVGSVVDGILRRDDVIDPTIKVVNAIVEPTLNGVEGFISKILPGELTDNVITTVNGVVVPVVNGLEGTLSGLANSV